MRESVATPLWDKCEDETHTPKSGKMESSGTSKNLELNCRGQISSHLSVLGVIGKVLKCKCQKWPCMSHLDISNPSCEQTKGRELNCQSWESTSYRRLMKKCDMALESSRGDLQLWLRPHSNWILQSGDMSSQSPKTPTRDNFGTPPWESREKKPFGCSLRGELQSILYGGRWWLPPSLGRGESTVSKCPWLVPTPKGVLECELTFLWLVLDADSSEINLVPLPSLILGLLARPFTPF